LKVTVDIYWLWHFKISANGNDECGVHMRDWFVKNLGDAMLALDEQERIKELFLLLYAGAEIPKGVAAFIRHESEGSLHCEAMVYFSPMAVTVAKAVNAKHCEKPAPDSLGVLVGSPDSQSILFS
jgi:hypothetical protein